MHNDYDIHYKCKYREFFNHMNYENSSFKDFQRFENPSIFTVRQVKNAPEQAACWQCDAISKLDSIGL